MSIPLTGHGDPLQIFVPNQDALLTVLEKKGSAWNDHCAAYPDEFECLYGVGRAQVTAERVSLRAG